jgi:tetratricopeptide (TPR) repeat protein
MMVEPSEFRVFLSAVSREFETARNEIANDLGSRDILVRVQRSFRQEADSDTTLRKLHDYISKCTAVVCVMGKYSGAYPTAAEAAPFAAILPSGISEASYTQWEFFFARHYKRRLSVYIASEAYKPDRDPAKTDRPQLQKSFLAYVIDHLGHDRTEFSDVHELCRRVANEDWPPKVTRQPRNLRFASLGTLFKGRDQFLETLHTALSGPAGNAAVTGKALHGLGGIGKTRLAIEYAWRHAQDYSALLFVPAETPAALNASLAALVEPKILDLPEKDAREDAVKIAAALGWLENHPTWLMILDNVDDAKAAAAVEELIPHLKGGHVLVTARVTDFSGSVATLPLDYLRTEDSIAFLLERTEGKRIKAAGDEDLVRELAGELGGLALGLEQAGAYIAKQRISFARYLKFWRENREKVLNWFDRNLTAYNHDVGMAATWLTSIEKLTPAGRRLLELCAFLAAEPIPDFLLDVKAPEEPADFDAHEVCGDLFTYSLAMQVEAGDGQKKRPAFAVHRLVQDFTRRGMSEEHRQRRLQEALDWVNATFKGDPQDVRTWPQLDPLAPHVLAIAEQGNAAGIAAPTASLYGRLDMLFDAKARYSEAERVSRRALAIDETSSGPDHPNVAIRLNNLAELLRVTNRLAEAEPLYRRALAIGEASSGPEHPKVAIRLNNLALLLKATNRLAEAEPLLLRALAIDEASSGPDHPKVAIRLNNLALLLKATNRLAEAEPLYRRALAIDEASYGPDHPVVAINLNNLAQLLQDTNRLAEAEPLMRRALAIDEASYGPDHPAVARDLNNLAHLLQDTNRLAEAEPLFRRALAIDEASYGPDHPKVATRLNNLASLLSATNCLAEAEPLMRRALAIDEASYGPDHPNVATDLNNLAGLLRATNRLAEAEPLYRRALAIDEASYGPDHPDVATDLNNLAALLRETDRLAEAEPLSRRHVEIFLSFTAHTGHEHPHLQAAFANYASLLAAMGRSDAEARAEIAALLRKHGFSFDGDPAVG